jgi:hypothetical protein
MSAGTERVADCALEKARAAASTPRSRSRKVLSRAGIRGAERLQPGIPYYQKTSHAWLQLRGVSGEPNTVA